jgi:cell division protein FtsI (penicillin-binding protein 3)
VEQGPRRRAAVVSAFLCALFFALLVRLYQIQVLGHEDARDRRDAQGRGTARVETGRGQIRDKNGEILACSVPMESVWVNPSAIGDLPEAARLLARALGLKEAELLKNLSERARREFVWVKHKVSPAEAAAVRALLARDVFKLGKKSSETRLGFRTEYDRRYPFGGLLAHVLGFQSDDPACNEGLERSLEAVLRGESRSFEVVVDGRRRLLDAPSVASGGGEAWLTIDVHLQKVVEDALDGLCAEFRPKWATAVVLDPRSGAILAISNRPTFDPNDPAKSPADARLNRAVVVPYEPGSTLKPFSAAWALDQGLARPDTMYDCENGLWVVGPRRLHDHHPYGRITLADIIIKSSNIGAAKIGMSTLGRKRLYECMKAWGFGEPTGSDLPAEDNGRLFPLSKWSVYSDTSVPMGHEIALTPLQLAAAMSAIANGGTLYRPFAVRRLQAADGSLLHEASPQAVRRVIGPKASREMNEILKRVVSEGTGKKGQVAGVAVAGKTGTTQKIDPVTKQYTHEKYISSFVGYAPADDPKVCVAVVVDEPQGAYYGGTVAAPVVSRIVEKGLVFVE